MVEIIKLYPLLKAYVIQHVFECVCLFSCCCLFELNPESRVVVLLLSIAKVKEIILRISYTRKTHSYNSRFTVQLFAVVAL